MKSQSNRKLHKALAPLTKQTWHRAALILRETGEIMFHLGASRALRFDGGPIADTELHVDADEDLYLTALRGELLLGVLFAEGTDIELVRGCVTPLVDAILPLVDEFEP